MALVSEKLKICGVKITVNVCGVPSFGSGTIYETPNYCDYNYVLTAKHILQEDSQTEYSEDKISNLTVHYFENGVFKKLQSINKKELKKKIILFEEDFAIIIVDKNPNISFKQTLVSDTIDNTENEFIAWATFSANEKDLHLFEFERNDNELRRVKLKGIPSPESLSGMSGAGVYIKGKNILYGVISRYPNNNFELSTLDCTLVSFKKINKQLEALDKIQLDSKNSQNKREINNTVIDIHQASINNVCLDLELARLRLKTDIIDDWFHDPLQYIDLLNQDYLFKQFENYFDNDSYEASLAEQLYVPKKKFTLRQALISPFIDRIVYMATVGVLAEKLDNALISTVYSARFNKYSKNQLIINGVEQWKKMQYTLLEKVYEKNGNGLYKYGCVIEIDLLNFYDNIHKGLLIEKIERVCETKNEKNACTLLSEIIHSFTAKSLGLPQNSDASALLATFYLNQVDVYMQSHSFAYYRFMDDIRIFCKDKYEARKVLQEFEFELRRCHLSVNSQKTEILTIIEEDKDSKTNEILRSEFDKHFDLEINKISRLRKSSNYAHLNQAFHESVKLLKDNIHVDLNGSKETAKRLNYALNTLEQLGRRDLNLYQQTSDFTTTLKYAIEKIIDQPWITTQICKVLNLLSTDVIISDYSQLLKKVLINDQFNTYSFQTYQVWLLLAKHKIKSEELIQYSVKCIEKNDETNRATIAAMIIYTCSVETNYSRVLLRKFSENFTHGYFQNRIALIALRRFEPNLIETKHIDSTLKNALQFTNKYKSKDLVYIQGFDEVDNPDCQIDQLYSI